MTRRHLLGLQHLTREEIERLLDAADVYAAQSRTEGEPAGEPPRRGATVATLFYEPSTRTEMSFQLAAKRLGMEVLRCDVDHSSVQKGESLIDTARTFEALGADILAIRHQSSGASSFVTRHVSCAVINAGDGMHEHPTQGLLDLLTIRQVKGRIDGLRVAIIGDILHSRVARSASWGLIRLGADVVLTGPATLLPTAPPVSGVVMTHRVGEALEDADVIMVLRMQTERQAAGFVPSLAEYTRTYGITEHTLRSIRPDAILMHPGPANLGVEISAAAAYGPRSVISRQVTNGTFIRMAVLAWTLGAAPTHRTTTSDARAHTTARRPRRTDEIAPVVS